MSVRKLREKGETRNKIYRDTDLKKTQRDKKKKKKPPPLTDELSGNYRCHFQEDETDFTTTTAVKKGRPGLGGV